MVFRRFNVLPDILAFLQRRTSLGSVEGLKVVAYAGWYLHESVLDLEPCQSAVDVTVRVHVSFVFVLGQKDVVLIAKWAKTAAAAIALFLELLLQTP